MKTILQITWSHIDQRACLKTENPTEFLVMRAADIFKEASRAKQDPSVVALSSHFALQLEQELETMGVRGNSHMIEGIATSLICAAIREWEEINREYEEGLGGPKLLS